MIIYSDSAEGVTEENLHGFFVDWAKAPTPALHFKSLKNSDHVILAKDSDTGNVVGFISAISDNAIAAYIPMLEVLPQHQNQGIGSELVTRMLAKLENLYMVDLICDEELVSYYERFGISRRAAGLMIRGPISDTD